MLILQLYPAPVYGWLRPIFGRLMVQTLFPLAASILGQDAGPKVVPGEQVSTLHGSFGHQCTYILWHFFGVIMFFGFLFFFLGCVNVCVKKIKLIGCVLLAGKHQYPFQNQSGSNQCHYIVHL